MWRPGLAVASCFANGRKCLTEQLFSLSTCVGQWLGGRPPGDQYPTLGLGGWSRPNVCCQCSKCEVSWLDYA